MRGEGVRVRVRDEGRRGGAGWGCGCQWMGVVQAAEMETSEAAAAGVSACLRCSLASSNAAKQPGQQGGALWEEAVATAWAAACALVPEASASALAAAWALPPLARLCASAEAEAVALPPPGVVTLPCWASLRWAAAGRQGGRERCSWLRGGWVEWRVACGCQAEARRGPHASQRCSSCLCCTPTWPAPLWPAGSSACAQSAAATYKRVAAACPAADTGKASGRCMRGPCPAAAHWRATSCHATPWPLQRRVTSCPDGRFPATHQHVSTFDFSSHAACRRPVAGQFRLVMAYLLPPTHALACLIRLRHTEDAPNTSSWLQSTTA